MHTLHAVGTRQDHQQSSMQAQQSMHQSQIGGCGGEVQQQQQQQQQDSNQQASMTVLESLEVSQQHQPHLMATMEHPHLVGASRQPHLHQLQPSLAAAQSQASMDSTGSQADDQQQQQQQGGLNQQQQQQNRNITNRLRHHRHHGQIDGIGADGGGPIVQWLIDNYEIADGESLPRSTVYNHYLAHCNQMQLASVNAASFGKLIRSVFVGLKTRRLGTRGHSKYHYFGVRGKQHIQQELLQHQEQAGCSSSSAAHNQNDNSNQNATDNATDSDSTNGHEPRLSVGGNQIKRLRRNSQQVLAHIGQQTMYGSHQPEQPLGNVGGDHQSELLLEHSAANGHVYYTTANSNTTNGYPTTTTTTKNNGNHHHSNHQTIGMQQDAQHLSATAEMADDFRNHLGANWSTLVDEHWPTRDPSLLERQLFKEANAGSELAANSLELFETRYKSYYKRMVELLSELKFFEVESLWKEFWNPREESVSWQSASAPQTTDEIKEQPTSDIVSGTMDYQVVEQQSLLTKHHLHQLTSQPLVVERIDQIDYNLYSAIESFLLPDMLSPIPRLLAQQIRVFAKNIGLWIEQAVEKFDPVFAERKSKSARAFGYALRRYTSLNHLSTASRAIWDKRSSLSQMSMDLSRVDLRDIEHQVSLMSRDNCSSNDHRHQHHHHLLNHVDLHQHSTSAAATTGNKQPHLNNMMAGDHSTGTNGANSNCNESTTNAMDQPVVGAETNENHNNNISSHNSSAQQQLAHNHSHHHLHHLTAMQPGQLIQNFLHLLEDPYPANSWPDWCRNLVESRVCGLSMEEARNFVLKWNFYISLIMKELTLRSAPSFGSFQLIRLLFDEYIFYLVVSRLAQAQHKTPSQLLSST